VKFVWLGWGLKIEFELANERLAVGSLFAIFIDAGIVTDALAGYDLGWLRGGGGHHCSDCCTKFICWLRPWLECEFCCVFSCCVCFSVCFRLCLADLYLNSLWKVQVCSMFVRVLLILVCWHAPR